MEYITSKCPHCKRVVKHTNSLTKYSSGSPLRTCPYCGNPYIDPDCEEPALSPYKPLGLTACIGTAVVSGLFFGVATILIIFAVGYLGGLYNIEKVHAAISSVLGIIWCILSFAFKYKGLKTENRERRRLWEESDVRLQNLEYAEMLKDAGFKVPEKYLRQK